MVNTRLDGIDIKDRWIGRGYRPGFGCDNIAVHKDNIPYRRHFSFRPSWKLSETNAMASPLRDQQVLFPSSLPLYAITEDPALPRHAAGLPAPADPCGLDSALGVGRFHRRRPPRRVDRQIWRLSSHAKLGLSFLSLIFPNCVCTPAQPSPSQLIHQP